MSSSPMISQYVDLLKIVNATATFSFIPLKNVISYDDIYRLTQDGFTYNVEYFDDLTLTDSYKVTSQDPIIVPTNLAYNYFPNIPFNYSTTIYGQLVKVTFMFNESRVGGIFDVYNSDYNYGEIYYVQWYQQYIDKFIGHANDQATVDFYSDSYKQMLINTTKLQMTSQFSSNLAGDYGSGLCNGYICTSFSVVVITSVLNSLSATSLVSIIFYFFLCKHYKNKYGIDINKIINDHDRIELLDQTHPKSDTEMTNL